MGLAMNAVMFVMLVAAGDSTTAIAEVRAIHGAPAHGVPGPWALLGHRIGEDALRRLGKTRAQSWDLEVVHHAPAQVKYACMMDGLQAATNTSAGKLNLRLAEAKEAKSLFTEVHDRKAKRTLVYRPTEEFVNKLGNIDYANFDKSAQTLFAEAIDRWVVVQEIAARSESK